MVLFLSVWLLDPALLSPDMGWRLAFGSGAVLGLGILYLRRFLPESPRWLIIHGRPDEAERIMSGIEARVVASERVTLSLVTTNLVLDGSHKTTLASVARTLLRDYPSRTTFGLVLMISQAFIYNAIFFTYALVLTRFYDVPADKVGLYILPFAVGNFLGPLLLGSLFDTLGRKPMIAATYGLSGLLLAVTSELFYVGVLDATTQTAMWSIVFFFCLGGGERGLPYGRRMLSSRNPSAYHRALLCLRHAARWRRRTVAVWRFDCQRQPR